MTSSSPVLATVWGSNVARSSVEDRCFYSNGTVPSAAAATKRARVDVGNDTVLVGRHGFYVRLRGYLHADDSVAFDCWTQQLVPETFTASMLYNCRHPNPVTAFLKRMKKR